MNEQSTRSAPQHRRAAHTNPVELHRVGRNARGVESRVHYFAQEALLTLDRRGTASSLEAVFEFFNCGHDTPIGLVPLEPLIVGWEPSLKRCYQILNPFVREMQKPENAGPQLLGGLRLAARPNCPGGRRQKKSKTGTRFHAGRIHFKLRAVADHGGVLCQQRNNNLSREIIELPAPYGLADDHAPWHHPAVCGIGYTRRSQFRRTDPCPARSGGLVS